MGKSVKANDWTDRAEQLTPDFYENAEAVTLEENPASQIELSDEEIAEPTVSIKFDSEGFAEEDSSDEAEPVTNRGPLEPITLPNGMGATEAGAAFAEILARVQEMNSTSKPAAIRYEGARGKVSSLPSAMDFTADVCIVARKAMSPALYLLFKEIYFCSYGENASSIPVPLQILIQQKTGLAFRKAGLFPFNLYWKKRVKLEQIKEVTLSDLDKLEERKQKLKDARNKRRRARRKAERPVTSTLEQAA
jgi:hypothetical protein